MPVTYESILALTDAFCRDHLDGDYPNLAQRMAATLCHIRTSPVASGQPRTWACAIMYVLGQINFLSDRSTEPYMTMADLCAVFGVGQSTASAKARVIWQALKLANSIRNGRCELVRRKPIGMAGGGERHLGRFAPDAARGSRKSRSTRA